MIWRSATARQASFFVEREPAGWAFEADGRRQHFGTSFMAMRTAIAAARRALEMGRPTRVMIQRPDGGWRSAWAPGQRYPA